MEEDGGSEDGRSGDTGVETETDKNLEATAPLVVVEGTFFGDVMIFDNLQMFRRIDREQNETLGHRINRLDGSS